MSATRRHLDRYLLLLCAALVLIGFGVFVSASLGLLARDGASFSSVASSQVGFGIILGGLAMLVISHVHYRKLQPYTLHVFIAAILLTLAVFIPGLGFEHNGARRWLDLGPFSFQPSELLKLGYVIYLASWFAKHRHRIEDWRYGLLPFLLTTGAVGLILLMQPDTGTFLVALAAGFALFLASGARLRDVGILLLVGMLGFVLLASMRPYVMSRIETFFNPASDPLGSSYQIQQSLIAIGSGGVFGRGFGQSVQKFNFLPEPIGDSIFAVAGEEFGFVGALTLVVLFVLLALRGFKIASRSPDLFGALLALGITVLIIAQSFVNIGAMLGILPLTGVPLIFVSHGGSAMFIALVGVGILLNISRYARL